MKVCKCQIELEPVTALAEEEVVKNLSEAQDSPDKMKKDSTDDIKIKAEDTTERLKNHYEKQLSVKEVEINQLNDVVTELKIKQNEEKTENKMLRRRIEQLQKSSKEDMEYQNKLETESEKLKLEIEQLRESSKKTKEDSPATKTKEDSPATKTKEDSPATKTREDSPATKTKENSRATKENINKDILFHIIPVDGPYEINCDGQSGGCFVWKDCGLEINFPSECSQQHIQVTMSTFLPIKNEVHPGMHIVSAVYQFNCNIERFDKAFTLHLQHCIEIQSPEDCQKMRFVIHHGDSNDMKYGCFEAEKSYGTVKLNRFCHIFIIWIHEPWKNIRVIVLPLSGDENNSSLSGIQQSSSGSYSAELSTSQTDQRGNSQSADDRQHVSSVPPDANVVDFKNDDPPYGFAAMFCLPKYPCEWPDWSGVYSIYYDLEGWKKVSKESMLTEKDISNFSVSFYADKIKFDAGGVAKITYEKTSEIVYVNPWPHEIKKEDVQETYVEYLEMCSKHPLSDRSTDVLRTIVRKSVIHVKKTSGTPSSNCQLIVKGIKPHQQVDLCTCCTNLTLIDTIDSPSTTNVNAGPVRSVSSGKLSPVNIDTSPQLKQSGILDTKPKMSDLMTIAIPLLKAEWDNIAYILDIDDSTINSIKRSHPEDLKRCCREMLADWLKNDSEDAPKTWFTLLNTIAEDKDFTKATEDILKKLEKKFVG